MRRRSPWARSRFRPFLLALLITYGFCVGCSILLVNYRVERELSAGQALLAVAVGSLLFLALGAYILSIVFWMHVTDTVWGYLWRGYVLGAGSNLVLGLSAAAFDLELRPLQVMAIYLVAPWPIVWVWLRSVSRSRPEHTGRVN